MEVGRVAEVAPLRRLPRTHHVFDYIIPANLEIIIGDLVEIPFQYGYVLGIVTNIKSQSQFDNLRPISKILVKKIVHRYQLDLTERLAKYNAIAWGAALKLAVPALKKRLLPIPLPTNINNSQKQITASAVQYYDNSQRLSLTHKLVQQVASRQQQALILVPEISLLADWIKELSKYFKIKVYHAELSDTEKNEVWHSVASGTVQIIVGSRTALFLPYRSLGGIIVDYAENENYKQSDQNPRYHAITAAKWLAELTGASLALLSPMHRVEVWHQTSKEKIIWRELPESKVRTTLIDLKHSRQGGNSTSISDTLEKIIRSTLEKGQKIFLYLNRRGAATNSLCRDYGYTPRCNMCQRPLALSADSTMLRCYSCSIASALPIPCPNCGGNNVNFKGTGLSKVEIDLNKLFPGIKIIKLEGKIDPETTRQSKTAQIVLGTRAAFGAFDFNEFATSGLVLPDTELALPEFRSSERILATAKYLISFNPRNFFVQTYRPDDIIWQFLEKTADDYYKHELAQRTKFLYPPCVELTRFTLKAESEAEAMNKAKNLVTILQPKLPEQARVVGPYLDYHKKIRGQFTAHILLKYKANYNPEVLWQLLPEQVIVDRNPEHILS